MTNTFDRRDALRFPITLPVELEDGDPKKGITRNISTSGVFFETDQAFSLGDSIRLTLFLESAFSRIPTCLHCEGRIVRTEQYEEKMGIAVAFMSYRFGALGSIGGR